LEILAYEHCDQGGSCGKVIQSPLHTGLLKEAANARPVRVIVRHRFRAALKREARYLAQRLSIILEKFAVDCANVVADNELADSSGGTAGERHSSLPIFGSFPSDADWKAIDPDLMDRVMSMPNELELAGQKIGFWWNVVGDEDCMATEADHQAGRCGLRAWLLAAELRKRCGIPASTLHIAAWDFLAALRRQDAAEKPGAAKPRLATTNLYP